MFEVIMDCELPDSSSQPRGTAVSRLARRQPRHAETAHCALFCANQFRVTSYSRNAWSGFVSDWTQRTCTQDRRINRYYDPVTGQFISVDPLVGSTGNPYAYAADEPSQLTDPRGAFPEYCNWRGFMCEETQDQWPSERDFESYYAGQIGLGTIRQYRVYPPSGMPSRIRYRNYDLYNQEFNSGSAWELKVGYQHRGNYNFRQIDFDVQLLLNYGFTYSHGGQSILIRNIFWREEPKTGGQYGLSHSLALKLKQAVNQTNGRFIVQIGIPESGWNSPQWSSRPNSRNQGIRHVNANDIPIILE